MLGNKFSPLGKNFKFWKEEAQKKNLKRNRKKIKKKIKKKEKKKKKIKKIKWNKHKIKNDEEKKLKRFICGEGFVEVLHYGDKSFFIEWEGFVKLW